MQRLHMRELTRIVLLIVCNGSCFAARYSRTTESRRQQRIEQKARLPVDMHLPLIPIDQQTTALMITYLVCIIILIAAFTLIIVFDKSALYAIRRVCCFCFCCLYGCGRFWNKRLDGDLECEEDDSMDELCCFKVSESVRKRRPVTLMEYHRLKHAEGYGSRDTDEGTGRYSTNRSKLFTEYTLPPLSTARNYKQRETVLKLRLEFLADLAAFMSARSMQQAMSEDSSSSEESAPSHGTHSSGTDFADSHEDIGTAHRDVEA
ncbi:unnamed protein product [Echinostoma caproni]|uniref:GIT domain-containing protein n=1 Tax=Echinostoma caproni TaxID=27848 RepID=A0A183A5I4_9TREM|nr:unnamed protein product [Echinostoma caproni]